MTTKLEALKAALEAGSPRPWIIAQNEEDFPYDDADNYGVSTDCGFPLAAMRRDYDPHHKPGHPRKNASLICLAVNSLPDLVAVAEAAQAYFAAFNQWTTTASDGSADRYGATTMQARKALREALARLEGAPK